MMGERDPQKQLWNYQVNLDKRVCSDHPLRRINETLELGFVRREVAKFYHTKGNVSEDPIIIMKMIVRVALCNILAKRSGSGVSEPWSNGPEIRPLRIVAQHERRCQNQLFMPALFWASQQCARRFL